MPGGESTKYILDGSGNPVALGPPDRVIMVGDNQQYTHPERHPVVEAGGFRWSIHVWEINDKTAHFEMNVIGRGKPDLTTGDEMTERIARFRFYAQYDKGGPPVFATRVADIKVPFYRIQCGIYDDEQITDTPADGLGYRITIESDAPEALAFAESFRFRAPAPVDPARDAMAVEVTQPQHNPAAIDGKEVE